MNRALALSLPFALLVVAGCGQNLGSTPDETWKLSLKSNEEIIKTLNTIKDDATADAALPKLEAEVERHNALTKKLDSYSMTMDEWGKLWKENGGDALKGGLERLGAAVKASLNAPKRADKIQAVLKKLEKSKKDTSKS
jgi:hypothetical protein